MGRVNGIAKNEEVANNEEVASGKWQRDDISAKRQGLISGVNMGSSVEERVREPGSEEGKASDQGRENDTRSDNSQEEKWEESFQVHNIRGVHMSMADYLNILPNTLALHPQVK